jgi:hypothetical protein
VLIVELGGASLRTTGLSIELYLVCIALGVGGLLWGILFRIITYYYRKWRAAKESGEPEKAAAAPASSSEKPEGE